MTYQCLLKVKLNPCPSKFNKNANPVFPVFWTKFIEFLIIMKIFHKDLSIICSRYLTIQKLSGPTRTLIVYGLMHTQKHPIYVIPSLQMDMPFYNNKLTTVIHSSATMIDNIYTNKPDLETLLSGILQTDIAVNCPVFLFAPFVCENKPKEPLPCTGN